MPVGGGVSARNHTTTLRAERSARNVALVYGGADQYLQTLRKKHSAADLQASDLGTFGDLGLTDREEAALVAFLHTLSDRDS